jgi:hypothetical protein
VPKQNVNPTTSLAIGSTFKLWVLLAVHDKLAASKGKLTWDTTLPIRDEAKSLPSGTMQNDPAGTTPHPARVRDPDDLGVRQHRDRSPDRLRRRRWGRGRAQGRQARHARGQHPVPADPRAVRAQAGGDRRRAGRLPQGQRQGQARVPGRGSASGPIDLETAVKDWGKTPRALDLEWFADARDLCNVMATLGARGKLDPASELLTILGKNVGVEVDRAKWRYVGFKGGSEPGVMNLTWLAQRADGTWFVIVIAVNDDGKALDEGLVANAATGVLTILGGETGK